jgi:RNA-directed DNA polymerase
VSRSVLREAGGATPPAYSPPRMGKSRKGKNVVRQVTAKQRYARALAAVTEWCRKNRHLPIPEQHTQLVAKMRGHYAYYGITGNFRRLSCGA